MLTMSTEHGDQQLVPPHADEENILYAILKVVIMVMRRWWLVILMLRNILLIWGERFGGDHIKKKGVMRNVEDVTCIAGWPWEGWNPSGYSKYQTPFYFDVNASTTCTYTPQPCLHDPCPSLTQVSIKKTTSSIKHNGHPLQMKGYWSLFLDQLSMRCNEHVFMKYPFHSTGCSIDSFGSLFIL